MDHRQSSLTSWIDIVRVTVLAVATLMRSQSSAKARLWRCRSGVVLAAAVLAASPAPAQHRWRKSFRRCSVRECGLRRVRAGLTRTILYLHQKSPMRFSARGRIFSTSSSPSS